MKTEWEWNKPLFLKVMKQIGYDDDLLVKEAENWHNKFVLYTVEKLTRTTLFGKEKTLSYDKEILTVHFSSSFNDEPGEFEYLVHDEADLQIVEQIENELKKYFPKEKHSAKVQLTVS